MKNMLARKVFNSLQGIAGIVCAAVSISDNNWFLLAFGALLFVESSICSIALAIESRKNSSVKG